VLLSGALSCYQRPVDPALLRRLAPREREVYALDRDGLSPTEIGRRLFLSGHTVVRMLERIQEKLTATEWHPNLEA
jgi:DNA-binding CsgD family transcriptional regulator